MKNIKKLGLFSICSDLDGMYYVMFNNRIEKVFRYCDDAKRYVNIRIEKLCPFCGQERPILIDVENYSICPDCIRKENYKNVNW